MNIDPELKAMNAAYEAIKDLEEEAIGRVVNWLIGKFSIGRPKSLANVIPPSATSDKTNDNLVNAFNSIAELFGKANYKTESDKVLLVAAYLQIKEGKEDLTGREINRALNHLGHAVKNITNTISQLINRKPSLMIQTRKEGKSQQAQKKYKVTIEGLKAASTMVENSEAVSGEQI